MDQPESTKKKSEVAGWALDPNVDHRKVGLTKVRNRIVLVLILPSIALIAALMQPSAMPAMLLFLFPMTLPFYLNPTRKTFLRAKSTLFDRDAPYLQFPFQVQIWTQGTKVGEDVGMVHFEDGWLAFQGLETTFRVSTDDVLGVFLRGGFSAIRSALAEPYYLPASALAVYMIGGRRYTLVITDPTASQTNRKDETFLRQLRTWSHCKPTDPEVRTILPPRAHPHADLYFYWKASTIPSLIVLTFGMTFAFSSTLGGSISLPAIAVALLFDILILFVYIRNRNQFRKLLEDLETDLQPPQPIIVAKHPGDSVWTTPIGSPKVVPEGLINVYVRPEICEALEAFKKNPNATRTIPYPWPE